jgi:glycerol-3-phosphate acyltransferase PlsY
MGHRYPPNGGVEWPGMWVALLVLFLAYLFGSIPAGVVVARTYGVDIRKVGSGNIGATNVLRALGWGPALVVAFFDVFKGGIAVLIARALGLADWLLGGVALIAVLGHNYSVFLGFKGGKGVATSLGTLLFLDPVLALWTFPIGVSVMLITRYVSAGSLAGGVAAFVLSLALSRPPWEVATVFLMAALIFWTHRENLKRLQEGTERRLGERVEVR